MNMVMVIARNLLEYFNSLNTYDIVFIGANILLMMLLVMFAYVLKFKDKKQEAININTACVDDSDISLEALTTKLQENTAVVRTDLTKFENEEETKAIISYDELVNTQSIPVLKYKNEEEINGLLNNSPTFFLLFALFPYTSIYVNGVNSPNEFLFLKERVPSIFISALIWFFISLFLPYTIGMLFILPIFFIIFNYYFNNYYLPLPLPFFLPPLQAIIFNFLSY